MFNYFSSVFFFIPFFVSVSQMGANKYSNDVSPDTDLTRDSLKSEDKYKSLGNIQTYRLVNYDLWIGNRFSLNKSIRNACRNLLSFIV